MSTDPAQDGKTPQCKYRESSSTRMTLLVTAIGLVSTIASAVIATLLANSAAEAMDLRAATRTVCTGFVVARTSLTFTGQELLRVVQQAKTFSGPEVLDIQEKRLAFDNAGSTWLRAGSELLLVADRELMLAAGAYNKQLQEAINATGDYFKKVADAGGSTTAGPPPYAVWHDAETAGQPLLEACRSQATKPWSPL